jgi:hypothetical protein
MISYPIEVRIGYALHSRLSAFKPGTIERVILFVLLQNQLRRIETFARREISPAHYELLRFFENDDVKREEVQARRYLVDGTT